MPDTYWTVTLKVMAFDTKEDAMEYRDALLDAFMEMPQSVEHAAVTIAEEHTDE